jgi:hypothetical protein
VFLEDSDHFLEPEPVIDEMVCAELPDPADRELTDIVKSAMIHGPAGSSTTRRRAWIERRPAPNAIPGRSARRFRWARMVIRCIVGVTNPHTAFDRVVNGKTVRIDNRWVVPYNPCLTRRYQAHINVEVCSSIRVIKYLYK